MFRGPVVLALVSVVALGASVPAAGSGVVLPLVTDAYLDRAASVLVVTATGSFSGGTVAANVVALQVSGVDQWVDAAGRPHVTPLTATPLAVRLVSTNTVRAEFRLVSVDDTVHIEWTAQAVGGLVPTAAIGGCAGTFTLVGRSEAEHKSC